MSPALILADEPTGNLDRATGEDVMRLLEDQNAAGVTLIVVTHDPALGARARRQLMMEDGRYAARVAGIRPTWHARARHAMSARHRHRAPAIACGGMMRR